MSIKLTSITTPDGICETYISYSENKNNLPVVLFFTDETGLRPRIYEMVDRLAAQGYFVMAPNYFYRGSSDLFQPQMITRDLESLIIFAKSFSQANTHKLGAVGYGLGGAVALYAATKQPELYNAVACFYAGDLWTDSENSTHHIFKLIQAEIYIAHADQDPQMSPQQMEKVHTALEVARANYQIELYDRCLHSWTMTDQPTFNLQGEKKHWYYLFKLFKEQLS